jgi:DNA-binding NtrC family response regulator
MNEPIPILVVSSELENCDALGDTINEEGWKTICASTVGECKGLFASQNIGVVFCERDLTDGTYRDVLAITRSRRPRARLVVMSRCPNWDQFLEALHEGAFDLITSPCRTADIAHVLNQAQHEDQMTRRHASDSSRAMKGSLP